MGLAPMDEADNAEANHQVIKVVIKSSNRVGHYGSESSVERATRFIRGSYILRMSIGDCLEAGR